MENLTKISVIMPVYNTKEKYLRQAIESILNQTYADFEFIIVNDGSTNNVEDVVLSYKDRRIVYIKQDNQGIVVALNTGWNNAKGEYIARMDSDDISYPDRFEKQVKLLEENVDLSLVGGQAIIMGTNKKINLPADVRLMDLLADCTFIHPSIMFRKADFDKYNLRYTEDAKYAEDYSLYAKAIRNLKMTNLKDVVLEYRVYPENSSSANRDVRVISSFKVQDLILDYMSNDPKIRNSVLNIAYKKKAKLSSLKEKIFSISNLYKNWVKYKIITVFWLEFCLKAKVFKK